MGARSVDRHHGPKPDGIAVDWQPQAWLGMRIPGLGVILTLLVIVLTGMFGANFMGLNHPQA